MIALIVVLLVILLIPWAIAIVSVIAWLIGAYFDWAFSHIRLFKGTPPK